MLRQVNPHDQLVPVGQCLKDLLTSSTCHRGLQSTWQLVVASVFPVADFGMRKSALEALTLNEYEIFLNEQQTNDTANDSMWALNETFFVLLK